MKTKTLTTSEIAAFSSQMALVLNAGISPYEGVAILNEDSQEGSVKDMLTTLEQELSMGTSLYEALEHTHMFDQYYLNMVTIGEQSGRLEDVMQSLSKHYNRIHEQNESLKSALTYPFIMIMMMLVVVLVLITKVLPIFNRVFAQLGTSMTGFSKMVLDFGLMLSSYSYVFILLVCVIIIVGVYLTKSTQGKVKMYQFASKFVLTRELVLKLALSKFSSGMAIALSSGLDLVDSLDMAQKLITHQQLNQNIQQAKQYMNEYDLSTSLVKANVLSGMSAKLIKIGEKTGSMDRVMHDIASRYNQETNERINQLINIIEPTLVAILSVFVGIIMLSIMLPLIGIMANL